MNIEWISQKGAGITALIVGLVFTLMAFFDNQYRYFYLCIAILALIYGYKKIKKRDTPFERRERELRRKTL
jgi:4-hydroxybenzoate polyprenyltransferase